MKKLKKIVLLFVATSFLSSCSDISEALEQKLNDLEIKTNQLDSLINYEVDKVMQLDSIIHE